MSNLNSEISRQTLLAAIINALKDREFLVGQPCQLTFEQGGVFSRRSVIGGQVLRATAGAYTGKRGDLILRFSVPHEEDIPDALRVKKIPVFVEIPWSHAPEILDKFDLAKEAVFEAYDQEIASRAASVSIAQSRAENPNPIVGSW